ncbi:uncharacterized protein Hap1MRO34_000418 [Clarias gariepinus]|uniref:uncharacterized protein LOC128512803 n=1 Tax=Clarias gariepinus TaxID=13013 RepID=UPI00234D0811|nr:uncharacterized protein LOC128512803 [Clarias gariepinus]
MGALIRILKAILLAFSFGFTKSSGPLQCYNDYDAELTCTLTLPDPEDCFENKASILISKDRYFECRFNQTPTGACECRIQDVPGFVIMEIFTVNVSKGNKIWHKENISTEASIKPRRPIITSVVPKPNGDFLITLNTTYTREPFSESLVVELTYGVEGSNNNVTKLLGEGHTTYEIVGRNLQPNAKYILRARVKSNYPPNKVFSDYSEAHVFRTLLSLQNILKIILPILCLILIICIFSIYFWFNRILKPWWDKIPTPKFSSNFVKQVPQLLSFQNELSSVSPVSTEKLMAKKISVESSHVQGENSHSSVRLGKGTDSVPLIYSSTSYEHVNEKENSSDKWFEFDKEPHSTTTTESYKNEKSYKLSSGMSNRTYSQSSSSSSFFFKQPVSQIDQTENILLSPELLDPTIEIDFDYSMWNGCTESGNSKLIHITPQTDETPVVLGYESLGEVCDHNALRSFNDPFSEKPFSIKKPENALFSVHDSLPIPMDEGYQCVA